MCSGCTKKRNAVSRSKTAVLIYT